MHTSRSQQRLYLLLHDAVQQLEVLDLPLHEPALGLSPTVSAGYLEVVQDRRRG